MQILRPWASFLSLHLIVATWTPSPSARAPCDDLRQDSPIESRQRTSGSSEGTLRARASIQNRRSSAASSDSLDRICASLSSIGCGVLPPDRRSSDLRFRLLPPRACHRVSECRDLSSDTTEESL